MENDTDPITEEEVRRAATCVLCDKPLVSIAGRTDLDLPFLVRVELEDVSGASVGLAHRSCANQAE